MKHQGNAFIFDVGETLVDESRIWLRWAQRLGVPPATFMGLIGAQAALDQPLEQAFAIAKPGIDLAAEEAAWLREQPDSLRSGFNQDDLYPDVIPALTKLAAAGHRLIIAGNQPAAALTALKAMYLPVDLIINSAELGYEKPDPKFFAAIAGYAKQLDHRLADPARITYVGDRLDNDVLPAAAAGMNPVLIRRGPWGYLHAGRPAATAVKVIDSLLEL